MVFMSVLGIKWNLKKNIIYSVLPEKLSLYQACPETVEEQIFAVARVRDIGGSLLHLAGCGSRSSVKVSEGYWQCARGVSVLHEDRMSWSMPDIEDIMHPKMV